MISTIENLHGTPAPVAPSTMTVAEIEKRAAAHAAARARLGEELDGLRDELEGAKRRRIKVIKTLAAAAAQTEADLKSAIEAAPELFKKPKTLTLHGIKVGYRTAQGKIAFDDAETVIKLIKRHLKDKMDLLIRSKEEVNKEGLKTLTATDLAKVGCGIVGFGERVVLEAVDDEVEKLVSKLIQDMVDVILEEERDGS